MQWLEDSGGGLWALEPNVRIYKAEVEGGSPCRGSTYLIRVLSGRKDPTLKRRTTSTLYSGKDKSVRDAKFNDIRRQIQEGVHLIEYPEHAGEENIPCPAAKDAMTGTLKSTVIGPEAGQAVGSSPALEAVRKDPIIKAIARDKLKVRDYYGEEV